MTHSRPVCTRACASLLCALLGLAGCSPGTPVPSPPTPPPPLASAPPPAPVQPPAVPGLQVLAAGNAASPPSLTAVTNGSRVLIDTVQPLHPAARPAFQGLRLTQPGEQAADALLGWQRASGELVLVPQPAAAASAVTGGNAERRTLRFVEASQTTVVDSDQVLIFRGNVRLDLPDVALPGVADGRVLTLTLPRGETGQVNVRNVEGGTLTLSRGRSLQVMAVKRLGTWLVIGRV